MPNKNLKIELVNELSFLLGLQEKVWRYHPDNPNAVNVIEEYNKLQRDIESIEKQLKTN
jgi:hypothetical protein